MIFLKLGSRLKLLSAMMMRNVMTIMMCKVFIRVCTFRRSSEHYKLAQKVLWGSFEPIFSVLLFWSQFLTVSLWDLAFNEYGKVLSSAAT